MTLTKLIFLNTLLLLLHRLTRVNFYPINSKPLILTHLSVLLFTWKRESKRKYGYYTRLGKVRVQQIFHSMHGSHVFPSL